MAEFFQTNREIIYFVYGQAFFVLGLAIALQSRKHSQLDLARHLGLLAVFGIVHGIYEWGAIFIPIQRAYLPANVIDLLYTVQILLEATSFFALFQFGAELVALRSKRRRQIIVLPTAVVIVWTLVVFFIYPLFSGTRSEFLVVGDTLARYLLGVPSALVAALALAEEADQVRTLGFPRIANYFRITAYAFAAYAAVTAIVPRGDFFPASILNYDVVAAIGIPMPIFRAVCGILIAYLIIRGLEIFDVETDHLVEEAAQAHAVAADRERIGRDLHDGIIQSLYGAGLMLEDAALTMHDDAPRAENRINEVIGTLNRTIRDIRHYILDLRSGSEADDWQSNLGELVRAFRLQTLIDAEFRVEGTRLDGTTNQAGEQVLAIAREALTNVTKHARASQVAVTLSQHPNEIELTITDNGIGLPPQRTDAREHQGLHNMRQRAQIIGGRLEIESAAGRGTTIRLIVPCT